MTTIDLNDAVLELEAPRPERGTLIGRLFRSWHKKRMEQRTLSELSRMPVHLLRDMGIEPADVRDALDGRRSSVLYNPIRKQPKHGQDIIPAPPARPR
jgi:uncharacterized protein YjiS (DUF1127 family)